MGTLTHKKFSELKLAPGNIRTEETEETADLELKASILAEGVIQNLIVTAPKTKGGKFVIYAGARRYKQVQKLIREKLLTKDFKIPVMVLGKNQNPIKIATIENTMRQGMSPVDEFEAFHRLHHQENMPIEDIAASFGKPELAIKKSLALGGVHADLREHCRSGELSIDALAAFTICQDQDKQLKIYKSVKKNSYLHANNIKQAINGMSHDKDSPIVKFLGLDNYIEHGGTVSHDLFGDNIIILDDDLLQSLVDEKLEASAARGQRKFKWIEIDLDYENKAKEYKQLPPANGEKYTVAEMENAGCILFLDHKGKVKIERGFVKKEDLPAARKNNKANKLASDIEEKEAKTGLSDSLKNDLISYRLMAVKADLLNHTDIAYNLALFSIVWRVMAEDWAGNPLHIRVMNSTRETSKKDITQNKLTADVYDDGRDNLPMGWHVGNCRDSYLGFLELSEEDKKELVAYCSVYSLSCDGLYNAARPSVFDAVMEQCGTNIADYWRPDNTNFFSRVNLNTCKAIGEELCNDPDFAETHKSKNKGQIAEVLGYSNEELPVDKCWLPNGMNVN